MSETDGREPPEFRNPASGKPPSRAQLPGWGVLIAVAVSLAYGWWQNGNQPPPAGAPIPRQVATVDRDDAEHRAEPDAQSGRDSDHRISESTSPPPQIGSPRSRDTAGLGTTDHSAGSLSKNPSKNPQTKPQPPPVVREPGSQPRATSEDSSRATLISEVILKNQDGKTVYQGPIDLQPTIDRIEKGERNRHRNDGTVFQNREGKLSRKPAGYYHEYVVPTPNQNGPGPQRLILGKQGEVYYTSDHYRSFRKIAVHVTVP